MTEQYVENLDQILENVSESVLTGETDEAIKKAIEKLSIVSDVRVKSFTAAQTAYEKELALQIEQDKVNLEKEKLHLENEKLELEKDKAKIDAAKLKLDCEKIEVEKRNSFAGWIQNGVVCILYIVGACVIPMRIMHADREGEFWSRPAMNSTDRGPKFGFIQLPRIFGSKK